MYFEGYVLKESVQNNIFYLLLFFLFLQNIRKDLKTQNCIFIFYLQPSLREGDFRNKIWSFTGKVL
jgi:hypothetical protein